MTSRDKRMTLHYYTEHQQRIALIEQTFSALWAAAALRFKAGVS